MLVSLTLAATLSLPPAQTGGLEFKNVRPTYAPLSHPRKDSKILPGEVFYVAFDIAGLKVQDDGLIRYSMGMELLNAKGESQFKSKPQELEVVNSLGGDSLPAFARAIAGTDTPPGEYTMKVTVKDLQAKTEKTLTHKFEILKPQFGFVRISLMYPGEVPQPAPPLAAAGQKLLVNFAPSHFTVDEKGAADVDIELRILDETGKAVLPKPSTGKITRVPEKFNGVFPQQTMIDLNRPGKFKLVIKATDNKDKKTIEHTIDLTVVEIK
jgi:hypothetical protein